jgi:hypothetical protein
MKKKFVLVALLFVVVMQTFAAGNFWTRLFGKSENSTNAGNKKSEYVAVPIRPRYSDPLEFENYEQQRFNWYMENLAPTVTIDTNKIAISSIRSGVIGAGIGFCVNPTPAGAVSGGISGAIGGAIDSMLPGGGAIKIIPKKPILGISR